MISTQVDVKKDPELVVTVYSDAAGKHVYALTGILKKFLKTSLQEQSNL